jgi:hypothetical protein
MSINIDEFINDEMLLTIVELKPYNHTTNTSKQVDKTKQLAANIGKSSTI